MKLSTTVLAVALIGAAHAQCDVPKVSTCLQGVAANFAAAGTDVSKVCPLVKEMKACVPANCADDNTINQITKGFAAMEQMCGGGSSGGCNLLEVTSCMTPIQEQIAAAGEDPTKLCPLISKIKACFPAACADNANLKTAFDSFAEAEKQCANNPKTPISGGGGDPCEDACGKVAQECMTKDPKNPACMTDAMKCAVKCQMPGIDPAQLDKTVTCMAGCQKDPQTSDACAQTCMADLMPACFKGPDGNPGNHSSVGKCMTAAGIPDNAEGDSDITTCAQLNAAKKCAVDSCGGKIPVMFEPIIKKLNDQLKCAGTAPAPAPAPTAKPNEIVRTGSPSVAGGTGSPTKAFTLSPTAAPANPTAAPAGDSSGASNLLPTVAVALGAVVLLA